jgi:hypothetical protein
MAAQVACREAMMRPEERTAFYAEVPPRSSPPFMHPAFWYAPSQPPPALMPAVVSLLRVSVALWCWGRYRRGCGIAPSPTSCKKTPPPSSTTTTPCTAIATARGGLCRCRCCHRRKWLSDKRLFKPTLRNAPSCRFVTLSFALFLSLSLCPASFILDIQRSRLLPSPCPPFIHASHHTTGLRGAPAGPQGGHRAGGRPHVPTGAEGLRGALRRPPGPRPGRTYSPYQLAPFLAPA